jgi:hypothetical protein
VSIYRKVEARSESWHLMRLGRPGSSEFHKIVTPTGKLSKQSTEYGFRLLAELMLGHPLEDVETPWMVRGTELEDSAIAAYEFATGLETQPGGIVTDDEGLYGCSPDRLVGEDGLLEVKCPAPNTHIGYLLDPLSMVQDKTPQVQGQLLCTGRKWVDLLSYHPEMPPVIARVERNEEYIAALDEALGRFCDSLAEQRACLESRYGPFPAIVLPADRPAPVDTMEVSDADVDEMISNGAFKFQPKETT